MSVVVTPDLLSHNTGRTLRVLIVEDNVDGADSMAMLLKLYGYDVRVTYDGCAAVKDVQADSPDVVLLDIGLPDIDGYEVCRRLRASLKQKKPFFIAVTGRGEDRDLKLSQEAGIDLHLVKPIHENSLEAMLKTFQRLLTDK